MGGMAFFRLATASTWDATTLAETFGVEGPTEDALYAAMDALLERQPAIEKRLAKRHLEPCGLVLYDLTSTYVEGTNILSLRADTAVRASPTGSRSTSGVTLRVESMV